MITWKQCADLPTRLSEGKTAIINGKVYCGGGATNNDQHIVYCYDPSQNKWSTLPLLPVYWFGLGQVNGKLVAVGGKESGFRTTNEVYTCMMIDHKNGSRPFLPCQQLDNPQVF